MLTVEQRLIIKEAYKQMRKEWEVGVCEGILFTLNAIDEKAFAEYLEENYKS